MKNAPHRCFLLLALILAGCSVTQPRPVAAPISLPPKPIVKNDFSFQPLNESGWLVFEEKNDGLILGARGSVLDETRVVKVGVGPMPANVNDNEFVAFAELLKKNEDPKRFEVLKRETRRDDSTGKSCVRIRATMKDSAPRVVIKRSDPMILDVIYWVCRHPEVNKMVYVEYSSRFYPENQDVNFEKNAEKVFHGLALVTH